MSRLQFSLNLTAPTEQLIKLATDYEKLPRFLSDQLKQVRIIKKENNETTTEETIVFSSIVKNQIIQTSVHKQIADNIVLSEIISGPAKGTTLKTVFEKIDSGTKVNVEINLKLSLKAKFLSPLIKKLYKTILLGILYKMNGMALEMTSNRS